VIVYPILAEIPDVVLNLSVVPDGGFTRPTVTRSVVVELNPLIENPLASWFNVFCVYSEAFGLVTAWENPEIASNRQK
jgi:hypothetical protein